MEEGLVSVIMPCYELETQDTIYKTLDSIVKSDGFYRYVKEIIPVVNGTNHFKKIDVKRIIKQIIQGEEYEGLVKIIELEKGVSKARNAGAKAAKGDILVFCDCDTTVHPKLIKGITNHMVYNGDGKQMVKDVVGVPPVYFRREHTTKGVYATLNFLKWWKNFYNRVLPFEKKRFDRLRNGINNSVHRINLGLEKLQDKLHNLNGKKGKVGEESHSYLGLPLYLPRKFSGTGVTFCSKNVFEVAGGFPTDKDCFEDRVFLERAIEKGAEFVFLTKGVRTSDRRYATNSLTKILQWGRDYCNDFMGRKKEDYNHSLEE